MIVRAIYFDDDGHVTHVDARLTADEAAEIAGSDLPALTSMTPQREPVAPAVRAPRRLTDAELVSFIDRIIERDPRAGRPVIQRELREQGLIGRNSKRLTRLVADRKRARLRALARDLGQLPA